MFRPDSFIDCRDISFCTLQLSFSNKVLNNSSEEIYARLMDNFILDRHGYPMIVVRSRNKSEYLEALHSADLVVGSEPNKGAHASLQEIGSFIRLSFI